MSDYQGPVRPTDDEAHFRKTGETITKKEEPIKKAKKRSIGFHISNPIFSKKPFLKKVPLPIKPISSVKILRSFISPNGPNAMVKPNPKITNSTGFFSDEFLKEKRGFDKNWLYADDFGEGL
jgi:hypothetical protein